jgi:protein-disulfide isomerase
MQKKQMATPDRNSYIIPAAILGGCILLGCLLLKTSLDRAADQLDGIRLGLADTRQADQNVAAAQNQPAPAQPARRRGPDPDRRYEVDIAGAPIKGPANAPVTVVEFSDFQ